MRAEIPFTVREAATEDAAAIADVHIRTWQAAYAGLLPGEVLASLDADRERRSEQHRGQIAAPPTRRHRELVAEADGRIVAFASVGPARWNAETVGEVYAIYLDPGYWGKGIGRGLFARATVLLAELGFAEAVLWVLGTNARARRFYESAGWRIDGATKREIMYGATLDEVRYRTAI